MHREHRGCREGESRAVSDRIPKENLVCYERREVAKRASKQGNEEFVQKCPVRERLLHRRAGLSSGSFGTASAESSGSNALEHCTVSISFDNARVCCEDVDSEELSLGDIVGALCSACLSGDSFHWS